MIRPESPSKSMATAGLPAVDRRSLEIHAGETFILFDSSERGTSITLKMICRLLEPAAGTIIANGRAVRDVALRLLGAAPAALLAVVMSFAMRAVQRIVCAGAGNPPDT